MVLKYDFHGASQATRALLQAVGVSTSSEHLKDTPNRVAKAWQEWTAGYHEDPDEILKTFNNTEQYCDWVIVHNVPIVSTCCHHLAPIRGVAHIGYIPDRKIVGLSKLSRIASVYMRRLQIQEALTEQIANCILHNLKPIAVGVYITAGHGCMDSRGVNIHGTKTSTRTILASSPTTTDFGRVTKDFMQLVSLNV